MDISVVIPTYNEAVNISTLLPKIESALSGDDYEIIVVDDDSPDETWHFVNDYGALHPHVSCMHRLHERGLSSAVVDGLRRARGDKLVVLDADHQHDPEVIPALLAELDTCDIVSGTRYARGGKIKDWNIIRLWMSRVASIWCNNILGLKSTDPMGGLFGLRRNAFYAVLPSLNPRGYKILMEILYLAKGRLSSHEVPYTFGPRAAGQSKLSAGVIWEFLTATVELRFRGRVQVPASE